MKNEDLLDWAIFIIVLSVVLIIFFFKNKKVKYLKNKLLILDSLPKNGDQFASVLAAVKDVPLKLIRELDVMAHLKRYFINALNRDSASVLDFYLLTIKDLENSDKAYCLNSCFYDAINEIKIERLAELYFEALLLEANNANKELAAFKDPIFLFVKRQPNNTSSYRASFMDSINALSSEKRAISNDASIVIKSEIIKLRVKLEV